MTEHRFLRQDTLRLGNFRARLHDKWKEAPPDPEIRQLLGKPDKHDFYDDSTVGLGPVWSFLDKLHDKFVFIYIWRKREGDIEAFVNIDVEYPDGHYDLADFVQWLKGHCKDRLALLTRTT